jgi:hypothetical protein
MGLVGSLWNRDTQARLQRIHQHIARQAASGEPSIRRWPPTFKRRRVGEIRDTIVAILAEQKNGLRMRDIAAAATTKLNEPIPPSTSSPVSRGKLRTN